MTIASLEHGISLRDVIWPCTQLTRVLLMYETMATKVYLGKEDIKNLKITRKRPPP